MTREGCEEREVGGIGTVRDDGTALLRVAGPSMLGFAGISVMRRRQPFAGDQPRLTPSLEMREETIHLGFRLNTDTAAPTQRSIGFKLYRSLSESC